MIKNKQTVVKSQSEDKELQNNTQKVRLHQKEENQEIVEGC